jgi:hypothetical protein
MDAHASEALARVIVYVQNERFLGDFCSYYCRQESDGS